MIWLPASNDIGIASPAERLPGARRRPASSRVGSRAELGIGSLIRPEGVIGHLAAADKAGAIRLLATRAASQLDTDGEFLFDLLMARERLGSTSTGYGFAVPHTEWKELTQFFGVFARLATPIDFGAFGGRRVDLVFMLLSPENAGAAHLAALAAIARRLRVPAVAATLRKLRDARKIYDCLVESPV